MKNFHPCFSFYISTNFRVEKSHYLTQEDVDKGVPQKDTAVSLKIYLISKMEVTEHFWSYGFMEWIAECGGYAGLFLGYSLSQFSDLIALMALQILTILK